MQTFKKHLIATAIETTWPEANVPVLFLGEWCKLYHRKDKWQKYRFETLDFHWNQIGKINKDYIYLNDLYESILLEVGENLNSIHSVNQSMDFWRILIGPWLAYFIHMLWDRYESLRLAFETQSISTVSVFPFNEPDVTPNDMGDFIRFFISDFWNQWLYQEILKSKYKEYVVYKEQLLLSPFGERQNSNSSLRSTIKKVYHWFTDLSATSDKYFLISDYLGLKNSFLIQFMLGQFPKRFVENEIPTFEYNTKLRNLFKLSDSNSDFENILKRLIPKQIPKSYVEGFQRIENHPSTKGWPKNPKVIFTCNSHIGYDVFKVWMANKKERGSKLVLSQHGGHYGIGKFSFHEDHEMKIADRYLTWGWKKENKNNVIPSVCYKYGMQKSISWDPNGNALLVQNSVPRYSYWLYSSIQSSQVLDYISDQFNFVSTLNAHVKEKLNVKLYPHDYGWDSKNRWIDAYPDLMYIESGISIFELMRKCRIFISTYNATTFLESLSLNIPTLIYWNIYQYELRENSIPFFEALKKVGIFHETPQEAASFLNQNWSRIPEWWNSRLVQTAREEFCKEYVRTSQKPMSDLKYQLTHIA